MTDTPNENEKESDAQAAPKIIVDSDWKEQVAKEKAAAVAADAAEAAEEEVQGSVEEGSVGEGSGTSVPGSEDETSAVGDPVEGGAPERPALPPPSFEILISMLFTQAISALGQMPNPVDGQTSVDKAMAKHSIDMIEMLETKTKGNLSDDESKMLGEALHALRMAYVGIRG